MHNKKNIALVLAGCGNKDGSEITEAVSAIIALSRGQAQVRFFAPQIKAQSKNFMTGDLTGEYRDLLLESARISRGRIEEIKSLNADDFDGLVLPGGFGFVSNLSTWPTQGAKCTMLPELQKALVDFHQQSKPIAAMCIAPTLVARALGHKKITITLGEELSEKDSDFVETLKTGALVERCPSDDFISDRDHKVLTTPAYMNKAQPHQVYDGIEKMIREFMEIA